MTLKKSQKEFNKEVYSRLEKQSNQIAEKLIEIVQEMPLSKENANRLRCLTENGRRGKYKLGTLMKLAYLANKKISFHLED